MAIIKLILKRTVKLLNQKSLCFEGNCVFQNETPLKATLKLNALKLFLKHYEHFKVLTNIIHFTYLC